MATFAADTAVSASAAKWYDIDGKYDDVSVSAAEWADIELEPCDDVYLTRIFVASNRGRMASVSNPSDPSNPKKRIGIVYDPELKVYKRKDYDRLKWLVADHMREICIRHATPRFQKAAKKRMPALLMHSTGGSFVHTLIDAIFDPNMEDTLDTAKHEMHFLNGYVDLRTGAFCQREPSARITMYNAYPFVEDPTPEIREAMGVLDALMKQIANNDDECHEAVKAWHGYCLTGETTDATYLFVLNTDWRATTVLFRDWFCDAFPAYSTQRGFHDPYIAKRRYVVVDQDNAGWRKTFDRRDSLANTHFKTTALDAWNVRKQCIALVLTNQLETCFGERYRRIVNTDVYRNALFHLYLPYAKRFYAADKSLAYCSYLTARVHTETTSLARAQKRELAIEPPSGTASVPPSKRARASLAAAADPAVLDA